jgi:peptidoglycan hydrolase-like protein with peptidoglycan-binding domain
MATYNQVSFGSKDKNTVTELQKMLNQSGNYGLEEDGIFGSNTLDAVKKYQQANGLDVDGIVGQNTWAALTKNATGSAATEDASTGFQYDPYQKSDTVTQAEALLQQHMASKPGEYQSTWQSQLNDIIQQIQNREKFSYDLNGDALYQQYKDQYMQQGKMAMMDTMGQAQAMTGGYGNSYAQTVGQQAYQGYLQQLNDKVPELYQLALSQYNAEGDAMYNNASLLAGMEEQDYGRYRDQVSDYNTELGRLTDDARYQAEQDYGKWADKLNLDYGMYRDTVADQQWQATFDEGVRQYNQQYALSAAKGSGGTGGGGTGGGGSWDNGGYDEELVRKAQDKVGAGVDGKWGSESAAKAKAMGYNSLADVIADLEQPAGTGGNGWKDYDRNTHKELVQENGGSYYKSTLTAMENMISSGKTQEQVMAFLQEAVGNSYITRSEYLTLLAKYRLLT